MIFLSSLLVLKALSTLTFVKGQPFPHQTSNLRPVRHSHQLSEDTSSISSCEIVGFSFYDSSNDGQIPITMYTDTLDLTDFPHGELDVQVNTEGSACQCVKVLFAGEGRKSIVEQFLLYRGNYPKKATFSFTNRNKRETIEGMQLLEAWVYTDKNCKGNASNYHSKQFTKIIPYDTPREVTLDLYPFSIKYRSSEDTTHDESKFLYYNNDSIIGTTCGYFESALSYGFTHKSDIMLHSFSCTGSASLSVDSNDDMFLKIRYEISATFHKWTDFNPYINRILPTMKELEEYIESLISGERTSGPHMPTLLEELQWNLQDTIFTTEISIE